MALSEPATRSRAVAWTGNPGLAIGIILVGLIAFAAIAAPLLTSADPYEQNLALRLLPPAWIDGGDWSHPLGTDQLGRDYLARLIYGSRVSLSIGLVTVLISGLIGTTLGTLAGFFGGRIDSFVTYLITVRLSMPAVIVALAIVALVGNSLQTIMTVLGLLLWDQFAVVSRSVTRQVASLEFISAARLMGTPTWKIILREVMPNIWPMIMVVATVEVASAIMVEASLSFLGLGVQPPTPSWGLMMAEGKDQIFFTYWLILFPGLALFALVLGINLLGDGLRDELAPNGID